MSTQGTGQANWVVMRQLAEQVSPPGGGGGTVAEINGEIQRLQSTLESLAPQWQSDAATAFYSLNQQWQDDVNKLNKALNDIADQLRASADHYQQAVDQSGDAIRNVGPA